MNMNFSICLIAKNEEKTLPLLLESLKEFQKKNGEILVLDTGSQDNTVKIARNAGCIVYEVDNKFQKVITQSQAKLINQKFDFDEKSLVQEFDKLFDFASARNYIADLASNDMIAMPDCDEEFTKFDLDSIQAIIQSGVEQLEYNFVFSHLPNGEPAIKFLHSKFYNRKKLKWQGIIHEVLVGEARRQFLGEDIILLEHWQNHETNRNGYLRGLALDCFLNPDNDRNSHYFGRELLWSGRTKSAIQELKRHIRMNKWPAEKSQSMIFLGDAFRQLSDTNKLHGFAEANEIEALDWYIRAYLAESNRREPLIRLAEFFYQKKDAQKVINYTEAALTIPLNNFYANHQQHYTYYPHEMLYWAYWVIGNKEKSKEHFNKALDYFPTNQKFLSDYHWYYSLPKVLIFIPTLGRLEGLKKCVESIKKLNYPQELIETVILEDEPRIGVPKRIAEGLKDNPGNEKDIIAYAANDMEFTPDSLISAIICSQKNNKRLVSFNSGELLPDNGNICEHFIIERSLIDEIGGEIFDTEFNHCGVDNLLWAKCEVENEAIRCEDAIIIHNHFSKTGQMDEVYKLGWEKVEEDRELLTRKLKELENRKTL